MSIVLLAGLGLLVGALLALTGAGGGAVAVPLLVLLAGLSMQQATAVALLAVGLASTLGALLALRAGHLRWRAAGLLGLAGMVTAPWGVWWAQRLPQRGLMLAFVAFLLLSAWRMARAGAASASASGAGREARAAPPCQRAPGAARLRWTRSCAWALARVGALAGLFSGLLGVGGGFVIVPALDRHSDLDLRSIQATSMGVVALIAAAGLAAAAWHGRLQPDLAWPFAAGMVSGLLLGRRFSQRLPTLALRRLFVGMSVLLAAALLLRALRGPG